MKTKLLLRTAATILSLSLSIGPASAQTGTSATSDRIGASSGVLVAPSQQQQHWVDPGWKAPDIVLTHVNWDGLPLSEVVEFLRDKFNNSFDFIIPDKWSDTTNKLESVDARHYIIHLRLKNVTAPEVFGAMNIYFEAQNAPLRWELTMNGKRPTAVLHILPQLLTPASLLPAKPKLRPMIFFVGDLLGKGGSPALTMKDIKNAIEQVWLMSEIASEDATLNFYAPAQLIIVHGTANQIDMAHQTLEALKQKVELERLRKSSGKAGVANGEAQTNRVTRAEKPTPSE